MAEIISKSGKVTEQKTFNKKELKKEYKEVMAEIVKLEPTEPFYNLRNSKLFERKREILAKLK